MKNLHITYGDLTLFDGPVSEIGWGETDDGITLSAKPPKEPRPSLRELLAQRRTTTPETNGSTETTETETVEATP